MMEILYESRELIAVNKPVGLAAQSTKQGIGSALAKAEELTAQRLFVVHRLDTPVTGVLLFAKSRGAAAEVSAQFSAGSVEKGYLAIVDLPMDIPEQLVKHNLVHNKRNNKSYVSEKGKEAVLRYSVVAYGDRYALLEVTLLTGRHHQIRAQLAAIGHPIRGDLKYGARRSQPSGGIALHAERLAILDPATRKQAIIAAPAPQDSLWTALIEARGSTTTAG